MHGQNDMDLACQSIIIINLSLASVRVGMEPYSHCKINDRAWMIWNSNVHTTLLAMAAEVPLMTQSAPVTEKIQTHACMCIVLRAIQKMALCIQHAKSFRIGKLLNHALLALKMSYLVSVCEGVSQVITCTCTLSA